MTSNRASKEILTSIVASLQPVQSPLPLLPTGHHDPTTLHVSPLKLLTGSDQETAKNILLTLHFLFPHELLPALDLIDRRLINHLYTAPSRPNELAQIPGDEKSGIEVYYVQSASASADTSGTSSRGKGRFRNAMNKASQFYEVRLDSWNCSCPAFAFSALKLSASNLASRVDDDTTGLDEHVTRSRFANEEQNAQQVWQWLVGGITTKDYAVVPVCKHILAVSLLKAAPTFFENGAVSYEASTQELAGWAAGWGEH